MHFGNSYLYEKRGECILAQYVVSVVAVSSLVALGGYICYGQKSASAAKTAMSIILLYTVCSPIGALLGGLEDAFDGDDFSIDDYVSLDGAYAETAAQAYAEGVKAYVASEYRLDKNEISVYIFDFDFESMRPKKIRIILSGSASTADFRAIENSVFNAGLGECEVEIDFS